MGGGTCFALSRAMVRDSASQDEAASLIGYVTMAMVVSPMVAPMVGGFLDARFGWRSIFLATLALAAPVALAAYALLPETTRRGAQAATLGDIARAFPALAGDKAFLGYALALGFTTASFFIFIAGAPYVVVETMKQSPDVYGLYFILNAGGYMIGNFVSGRFGQRLGSERLVRAGITASMTSMALALAMLIAAPWTPATFFLPLMLNAVGNGMTIPGGTALALSVRPDLAGTAAGLMGAMQLGLGALGSIVIGYTVPLWPASIVWAMLACILIAALALAAARLRVARTD
jgi:DHA1 family bicyclomycin/chloramphenicol resistance-like MFS transporter